MTTKHNPSPLIRDLIENATVSGYDLLMLLVMAEYSSWANVQATQEEIGRWCRLSERQVRRSLKRLGEAGHLSVNQRGNGRGNPTSYHINVTPYFEEKF